MSETDQRSPEDAFQSSAPEYVYWSAVHTLADERLAFAVNSGILLTIFTGEIGTGKTTLAQKAVSDAQATRLIGLCAYGPRIKVDPCRVILEAFGADPGPGDKALHRRVLQQSLIASQKDFVLPTLILDDAHLFTDDQLLTFFELARFGEDPSNTLFKIILVGHPELPDRLDEAPGAIPGPFFTLEPMSEKDTAGYIRHRLTTAGIKEVAFDDDAISLVHERTGGNPQQINLLCQPLLVKAASRKVSKIGAEWVRSCKISSSPENMFEQKQSIQFPSVSNSDMGPEDLTAVKTPPTAAVTPKGDLFISKNDPIVKSAPLPAPSSKDGSKGGNISRVAVFAGLAGVASLAFVMLNLDSPPDQSVDAVSSLSRSETGYETDANESALVGNGHEVEGIMPSTDMSELEASSSTQDSGSEIGGIVAQPALQTPAGKASLDIADTAPALALLDAFGAPPEDISDWYRLGLSISDQNAQAAVVAYILAASRGHPRAAYFLGQMYELGEGVPIDTVLARIWYEKAAHQIDGAAARLAALQVPQPLDAPMTPIQLVSFITEGHEAVLVWTSDTGADPTAYAIDFADLNGKVVSTLEDIVSSVLRHVPPELATYWRVRALSTASVASVPSDWMPLDVQAHRTTGSVVADP
ncbi:AAA family ATPase [Aliiroseovarius sp. F47248L]|uniref:AAA family ATPase n=1 Tax=Aliiroseovarius sp. F47248L TaxID=2926420 RepID=UPI001FF153D3|nr:AAA family ATPase [Aliiroseovarius sp. F47248L]MCK0139377.1 AAA family ATPase [Aliiroseovarius sp. F47248L]